MSTMINRRRVMGGGSGLPYDAEIEYLESQGGCNIPTDIVPTGANITIKTKINFMGYTDNTYWVNWFQSYTNEQTPTYRIIRRDAFNDLIFIYNSGIPSKDGGSQGNVRLNTLYNIEIYPGYCLINGTRVNLISNATPVNTGRMTIFSSKFKGRFYFFYMADGDNVLLDLIPVRVGTTGYMYDKVSGQLFGNAGTSNFILGADK